MQGDKLVRPERVSSVLLTFNGRWGLLPAHMAFPTNTAAALAAGISALRVDPWCIDLWRRVQDFVALTGGSLSMSSWSCALEVSENSGTAPGMCERVHFHMFCAFRIRGPKLADWPSFEGSQPHLSRPAVCGGRSRGRHASAMQGQGHYYCLAPKTSSLFSCSSDQPKLASFVRTNWIVALYAEGKMTAASAVSEVVKYRRDVSRTLAGITAAESAADELALGSLVARVERAEQELRRPRVYLPLVEVVFLGQFERFAGRRKFLVLTGPSGLGKTDYVRSLVADETIRRRIADSTSRRSDQPDDSIPPAHGGGVELLEVSSHGSGETLPDVKDLSPLKFGWLLVDEVTPQLVINNRRLFQGKSGWTNISASATNVYARRVCSWGIRIIGTCNDWHERSAMLVQEDRQWLVQNSIVVDVDGPLWR
jgi:hypothetical protein